jgi:hypothetical protein
MHQKGTVGRRVTSSAMFLLLTVVGLVAAYYVTYPQMAGVIRARSWQEVPCVILTHEVVEKPGRRIGRASSYTVAATYSYLYAGRELVGSRYDFSQGWSAGRERALSAVEAYPPGTETTCFVDPESPASSVVDRSPGLFLLWGLMPFPFILFGVGGLLAQLRGSQGAPTRRARNLPP